MSFRPPWSRAALLALALLFAFVGALPASSAAVAACTGDDASESDNDVETEPAQPLTNPTALNRAEIVDVCITETATETLVVATMAANIESNNVNSYSYTLNYKVNGSAATPLVHTHSNGQASGAGTTSEGAKVQFTIPKTSARVNTTLTEIDVSSDGHFLGEPHVVHATDSARIARYTVGERAPQGVDSDSDGVDDRTEIADKTDPNHRDTDRDGLSDGAEKTRGTNPRNRDHDGDGLSDGDEVNRYRTDPTLADTDGDGLSDGDEVNKHKTDPTKPDTDGDGLSDGDEVNQHKTDATKRDTDGDGLSDGDEVRGELRSAAGQVTKFNPTDPTKSDSDGDGFNDADEVRAGSDPRNGGAVPETKDDSDITQYLPLSGGFLLLLILVSLGGIVWRWG